MAVVNGNNERIKLATLTLANVRSEDFGQKLAMIDITTKDSAGDKTVLPGLRERTMTAEMLYEKKPGSPTQYYVKDLQDAWDANTSLAFQYLVSATSGDIKYTGNLYVESIDYKSKNDDVVTVSATFAISGAVTVTTV